MIDLSGIAPQKCDIVARKNALLKAKTGDNVVLYEVLGLTVRNNVNVAYVRSVEDDNFLVINRVFVADLEVIEPSPLRKLELMKDISLEGDVTWYSDSMNASMDKQSVQGVGSFEGMINALWELVQGNNENE